MTRKAKFRLAAALLVAAVPALVLGAFQFIDAKVPDESSNEVFGPAGFLILRPAIAYHAPGTFNTVEAKGNDSVVLHPTCQVDLKDIEGYIIKADTISGDIQQKLTAGYNVDPSAWSSLNLAIKLDGVRNIRVSFTNSKIWMLSTEAVYKLYDTYLKGSCQTAIMHELRQGYEVCQSISVVVSDVVYKVAYEAEAFTGMQIFESSGVGEKASEIAGQQIFHAVKLHKPCLLLNDDVDSAAAKPAGVSG